MATIERIPEPGEIGRVEYRVRPVTRYIVTRFETKVGGASHVEERGEYGNEYVAYEVGTALCKAEHDRLGWPVGDERICYPAPWGVEDAAVDTPAEAA